EDVVHDVEDVGRVDLAVAVRVARHHAGGAFGRRAAEENVVDQVEDVGWVDEAVAVRVELLRDVVEGGQRSGIAVGIGDGDDDRAGSVRWRGRGDHARVDAGDVGRGRAAEGDGGAALESAAGDGDGRAADR